MVEPISTISLIIVVSTLIIQLGKLIRKNVCKSKCMVGQEGSSSSSSLSSLSISDHGTGKK